jgi:hypothetical protein
VREGRGTPQETTSRPTRPSRPGELREAIAREKVRLEALEAEQGQARARLAALRSELASLGDAPDSRVDSPRESAPCVPETPAEKVRLFRSLVRGRASPT